MPSYKSRNAPYQKGQKDPYKISRSKIELFMQCPRCFWLDARLKIKRPDGPPFNLNKAIDQLLKNEFDLYRKDSSAHPIMLENNVKAVPFSHPDLEKWRHNFTGIGTLNEPTNLYVYGAVDDVWVNPDGSLIIVDYKATSKTSEVNLDAEWQNSYKRQMEVYQWLFRQNGFKVNNRGYFVYVNGRSNNERFDEKLEFDTKLLGYDGDDSWIQDTLRSMKNCLEGEMPEVGTAAMGGDCDFCTYARARTELTLKAMNHRI